MRRRQEATEKQISFVGLVVVEGPRAKCVVSSLYSIRNRTHVITRLVCKLVTVTELQLQFVGSLVTGSETRGRTPGGPCGASRI
jgi:hypothetical protein